MTIDSLLATPVGNYLLDELVDRSHRVGGALTEIELYACVTSAAAHASSERWRVPPVRMWPWDAVLTTEEATALSDSVLASEAARWWSSRALDREQLWIGARDAVPQPGRTSSEHYGKPPNEIWTSSRLDDGTSAWWPLLREGADSPPPTEPQSLWRLTPSPNARVYEVTSPHDWARLLQTFADWEAVATQYDGIHLSVEGLIRAQGVAYESTMLDAWDAESTAWLRWCFDKVERVGELEPDGLHISTPVRHNPIRRGFSSLRARRPS